MRQHGKTVRRVAGKLERSLGVPSKPLYRGVLLQPHEIPADRRILPQQEGTTFSSWSEDRDVACWFADRDAYIADVVVAMKPDVQGWLMEVEPSKAKVLWHYRWADRFPDPDGRTIGFRHIVRRMAPQVAMGMASSGHPVHPADAVRQIEWALESQREVVLDVLKKKLPIVPQREADCPPSSVLAPRFQPFT